MTEELVAVTVPRTRADGLRLALRLFEVGIPSMLVPDPGRGGFALSVPRGIAREAGRQLVSWAMGEPPGAGVYRTADDPDAQDERLPNRRRRLAACFALGFGFGLGHVYAREYLAGLLVGLGQLACLVLAAHGMGEVLWAFPALMLLDAWGAVGAVQRENDGRRREPAAQLASRLPAVALMVASAALWMPSPTDAPPPETEQGAS